MKLHDVLLLVIYLSTMFGCKESGTVGEEIPSRYYTDSIYSEELGEYRKHEIYLPKGFNPEVQYPIIYGADGQMWQADNYFKKTLDSLIDNKIILPVILVGSHSNDKEVPGTSMQTEDGSSFSMQYRFFEYVRTEHGADLHASLDNIYQRHMNYFVSELLPQVEGELGQEPGRADRFFYGVSNGAAFGANLIITHPSLIGSYVLYSTLGANISADSISTETSYPRLYVQYGDQESDAFRDEAENLRDIYRELGAPCELTEYKGGHQETIWRVLFTEQLVRLFSLEK